MEVPNWVTTVLSKFEDSTQPHNEVQVADALRQAANGFPEMTPADFRGYYAEWAAFLFNDRRQGDSPWGTYFAPMLTTTATDGSEFRSPDIAELDGEAVEYWERRAKSVCDPVMRARYADLVWDLKKTIANQRPSHEYARIAVDAYLESTNKGLYTIDIEGADWLRRALDLALSVADMERARRVVDFIFVFYDRILDPRHIGVWTFPFDTLYDKKDLLTTEQENRLITALEAMLERTSGKVKPEEFDPFGAQAAAERLAKHYERQKNQSEVERVIRTYGEAFARISKDASPMLAMAWLQPVIERYQQTGLKGEAEKLQLLSAEKGKNIAADMKRISVNLELKPEELEAYVDSLTNKDLHTSLSSIAAGFVPSADHARKFLDDIRTVAPLQALIPVMKVEDGRLAAQTGSMDDDPEGRLHMQLEQIMRFSSFFLVAALARVRERYVPTTDDIVKFLFECPLFVEGRRGLLSDAVSAYLQDDFVKAIHVIVPQVEQILRNLLAAVGIPTSKPARGQPGIMDAKTMNDVLIDRRIQQALPESYWRYFFVLYVDRRGINLRNRLAHGLVDSRELNRQMADQVFHSLLALSMLRPKS